MSFRRSPSASLGALSIGLALFIFLTFFVLPPALATTYQNLDITAAPVLEPEAPVQAVAEHVPTPTQVKGVYMSQCVASTPSIRERLVRLVRETDLNTIVVDIKDFTGYISFSTENSLLADSVSRECRVSDMHDFIKALHAEDIYIVGRITVFQDPRYTKLYPEQSVQSVSRPGEPWKDHKGLSFISPLAKPYWEYVIELSRVSYEEMGFDEINYDYIRWPSDGDMKDVAYPPDQDRAEAIEHFWQYLAKETPKGAVISADLFGYAAVFTDDLGIGQQLERALPYFDYIMPMVYPSHYNKGFAGIIDVNSNPYKVVYVSMVEAVRRTTAATTTVPGLTHAPIMAPVTIPAREGVATSTGQKFTGVYQKDSYQASKMRPWLQDFNYPVPYTPEMVAAQIKATEDAGLDSWIFWDASNKYTSLRKVLTNTSTSLE